MERFICDVRGGAVAVYRGPRVNCFGDLPATLFYGRGEWFDGPVWYGWYVDFYKIWWAHYICFVANMYERLGNPLRWC